MFSFEIKKRGYIFVIYVPRCTTLCSLQRGGYEVEASRHISPFVTIQEWNTIVSVNA